MKVLILQPWIDYRGAETICVYLAYYLKKSGNESQIISLYKDDDMLPHLAEDVDIDTLPSTFARLCKNSRFFLFLFGSPLLLIKALIAKDIDLINAHNLPAYWIAAIVGRLRGIPVVWTAHTVSARHTFGECRDLIDYLTWVFGSSKLDNFFVSMVDEIIVSCRFSAAALCQQHNF